MRRLYEHALLVGVDYLVVLEDDAIIHSGTQLAVPEKFDVVFFNDRMFATPDGRTHSGCGTDGYLLSKSGIEKMLKILEGANEPADLLMIMQLRSSLDLGHPLSAFADPDKPLLAAYHSGPYVTHAEILPRVLPGRLR
jgi:GR25 family glycosyltransferase involved in LPS biosynthesis